MTSERATGLVSPAVIASRPEPEMDIARQAADVIEHMLGDGYSVIDPRIQIWTSSAAEDLRARVAKNPVVSPGQGQWHKLDVQLAGAPREVVLLAAEIVFLREHAIRNLRPETKREHLESVLAHLDESVTLPSSISDGLDRNSDAAGLTTSTAYNSRMWRHVIWVATFVIHWQAMPDEERAEARVNPWGLQRAMLASGPDLADIRNVIQYLAWPEIFEPIASSSVKLQIRDAQSHRLRGGSGNGPVEIDRDLLALRESLAQEVSTPFQFWTAGVRELWAAAPPPAPDSDAPEPRQRRYWLYSPGEQASMWDEFLKQGIMAIGWDELGDLKELPNRESIRQALDPEGTSGSLKNVSLAIWEFQNSIAVGDIVYAKRGRREIVGRGEVVSEARYEPSRSAYRHVRSVRWTSVGSWEHPGDAAIKTLTDVTRYRDYVAQLESLILGDEDDAHDVVLTTDVPDYGKSDFLREVYLDEPAYSRLRALLSRKKNVILAGPPGVGKTFAAKRLAYSIMGAKDTSRIQTVQFHQSYSYEDFMMGYRPTSEGGFSLAEGPFYRFCEAAAADDEDRPYFFIIDEINRGNISKIFGELLMLIEADKRGQQLPLLYKNEDFAVPPNLYIIGMMNTADRSLAVLDYALRRRFGFFEMKPAFDSVGFAALVNEVNSRAFESLVDTIRQLNDAIAQDPALGTGFLVGHSYLVPPVGGFDRSLWLHSVVEDELIPLLDEYWFDQPETAREWAQRLRGAIV